MVSYFQSGYLSRYLFIFFLAAIYWVPSFIIQTIYSGESLPAFNGLLWLCGNNYYISLTLAFFIIIFSALAFNHLCSDYGISEKVSTLGGFLFIVLSSSQTFFTTMSPFVIITFILLVLIRFLYAIPESNNQISLSYNSGLLVGFAALFYTQTIFLLLVIWIALYIHRSDSWRNYIVAIIGVTTPILFAFIWYFWTDRFEDFLNLWINLTQSGDLNQFLEMDVLNMVISVFIFLFVLFAILRVLAGLREKSINLRRNLMITFYFFVAIVLMVLFSAQPEGIYLFVIPSSILLVQTLNKPPKERLINLTLSILVLLIFINQYSKLLNLI